MSLYHVCIQKYKVGDIISPGNFGVFINNLNISNQNLWLENVLESSRKLLKPTSISRLNCIYAFNDINNAESYSIEKNFAPIYELTILNGTQHSIHNFKVISYFLHLLPNSNKSLNYSNAHLLDNYWIGNTNSNWNDSNGYNIGYVEEVLIGGHATIIGII
jgi:hypothetical protein